MEKWNSIEKHWDQLDDVFVRICKVVAGIAFVIIVLLTSMNVVSRYVFSKSFNWAEEICYLCFNWVVFLGVVIVYRNQGLTAIDLVLNKLPPLAKRVVQIIGYILVCLANVGLIVWGTKFAIMAFDRKSSSLLIPYFFYDVSIPIAAVMLLSSSLKYTIKALIGENVDMAALEDRM